MMGIINLWFVEMSRPFLVRAKQLSNVLFSCLMSFIG
jgi:hypothetical protein